MQLLLGGFGLRATGIQSRRTFDGTAHRYFTSAKRIELMMGGTTAQARAIGRVLAAEPA